MAKTNINTNIKPKTTRSMNVGKKLLGAAASFAADVAIFKSLTD